MLSGSTRFQKKKNKVSPQEVSLNDLASLVKRLSVQVDDLVVETNQKKIVQEPPLFHLQPITVDPWASHVPQNYGALLQRLEDMDVHRCPNECCTSVTHISAADGVPWPQPLEPFRSTSSDPNDLLDQQYTHWCTLMRCLPLMDPVTSVHVKTVGLYAMREILKMKAQKQHASSRITLRNSMSWGLSETLPIACMNTFDPNPPPLPPKESSTITTPTPYMSPQRNRFKKWIKRKTSRRNSLNKSWLL